MLNNDQYSSFVLHKLNKKHMNTFGLTFMSVVKMWLAFLENMIILSFFKIIW